MSSEVTRSGGWRYALSAFLRVLAPSPGASAELSAGALLFDPLGLLHAERDRWALWLPVVLGTGIATYFVLPVEPPSWAGGLGVLAAVGSFLLTRNLGRKAGPAWALTALVLVSLAFGFAIAQFRSLVLAAPILERSLGPVEVSGRIVAVEPRAKGERLVLERPVIDRLDPQKTPVRVRVTLAGGAEGLYPGDWVRGRAKLSPPPEPAAPGAYDFARAAYFKQLGAVGFAYGAFEKLPDQAAGSAVATGFSRHWEIWWADLRHRLSERIVRALPGDAGAIAAALMTGERGRVPEAKLQALRDAGLAHLLAISGLHIGLVAAGLFFGARGLLALIPGLALNYPIKKWAVFVALPGAFAYLMLVGASIPAQRAFLMTGLVLLAVLLDRRALSMRLVAWAAVVTLLIAPESLVSVSFQMSFAAVTVMIAAYEGRRGLFRQSGNDFWSLSNIGRYAAGIALTSALATLATAPFAVYHFNHLALYGVFANVIAVPLTALWVMPWAIVAFLLMPFGLEAVALWFMGLGIEGVVFAAEQVAAWPSAVLHLPAMPTWGLVAAVLGGLWLSIWKQLWRCLGVMPLAASVVSLWLWSPPDILISADARLAAIRLGDAALWRSSYKVNRFAAEIWLRRSGFDPSNDGKTAMQSIPDPPRCDPLGCIAQIKGRKVALAWTAAALAEDCALVDVMVSRVPIRRACGHPELVIDRFDLWREGAHAIRIGAKRIDVETVAQTRGQRPWVIPRGASDRKPRAEE